MMLLDVAPPDFAIVDGWAPVADGPFGVMGCRATGRRSSRLRGRRRARRRRGRARRPRHRRRVAGTDRAPGQSLVRLPCRRRRRSTAIRPDLHGELRGAHASAALRVLGTASYPIYMSLSNHGELFVPEMDPDRVPAFRAGRRWRPESCDGARSARSGSGLRQRWACAIAPAQIRGAPSPRCAADAARRVCSRSPTAGRFVRSLFLASLADTGLGAELRQRPTVAELAASRRLRPRPDRLQAWLDVGVEVGELTASARSLEGPRPAGRGDRRRRPAARPRTTGRWSSIRPGRTPQLVELLRERAPTRVAPICVITQRRSPKSRLAAAPFILPFLRDGRDRAVGPARARRRLRHRRVHARVARRRPAHGRRRASTSPPMSWPTSRPGSQPKATATGLGDRRRRHPHVGAGVGHAVRPRHAVQQPLLLRARRTGRAVRRAATPPRRGWRTGRRVAHATRFDRERAPAPDAVLPGHRRRAARARRDRAHARRPVTRSCVGASCRPSRSSECERGPADDEVSAVPLSTAGARPADPRWRAEFRADKIERVRSTVLHEDPFRLLPLPRPAGSCGS